MFLTRNTTSFWDLFTITTDALWEPGLQAMCVESSILFLFWTMGTRFLPIWFHKKVMQEMH